MNLFGNKPEERALATLIHDTNSSLGSLKHVSKTMEHWLRTHTKELQTKEIEIKVSPVPFVAIEYIKRDIKVIQESIDIYYKKLAELTKD